MLSFLFLTLFFFPQLVWAHCPLCTVGAGAAALAATWIGIKTMAVAVFVGAFGFALGLWLGRSLKKQYFRFQDLVIGLASFLLTVLPLWSFFHDYGSINVFWWGEDGSWFNRVYLYDRFWVGTVIGATTLWAAPFLSQQLTKLRGVKFSLFRD